MRPAHANSAADDAGPSFCGQCGSRAEGPPEHDGGTHGECRRRASLEPPRYCTECGRRMKVQVTPRGWSAACSRHPVLYFASAEAVTP